jgi:hypothetical protein
LARHNKVRIETIIGDTDVDMKLFAETLNTTTAQIYCGYLRQPITHSRIISDTYIIKGQCALFNESCSYNISPNSSHTCDVCSSYQTWLKESRK